jgi:hypothetical protein
MASVHRLHSVVEMNKVVKSEDIRNETFSG